MSNNGKITRQEREDLPLSKAAQYLLEECRMVLPGIQTLFGFQLIAVFNEGFAIKLSSGERRLHLVAMALLAMAIALIMTPAAYHRQTDPTEVTAKFIRLASRLLLSSMVPLAAGICIDFYLVGHLISASAVVALLAGALFAAIVTLWFVLPRLGPDNWTFPPAFRVRNRSTPSGPRFSGMTQRVRDLDKAK